MTDKQEMLWMNVVLTLMLFFGILTFVVGVYRLYSDSRITKECIAYGVEYKLNTKMVTDINGFRLCMLDVRNVK